MKLFGYGTGPMYYNGEELNHHAYFKKHGVNHLDSWFWFAWCSVFGHRFHHDPDICKRCGVFVG